jgi:hypothetical protein
MNRELLGNIANQGTSGRQPWSVKLPRPNQTTINNVPSSVASITLLLANESRLGATIFNDSTKTLRISLGPNASSTNFTTKIPTQGYYEIPFNYVGIITGLWEAASGAAKVTELS